MLVFVAPPCRRATRAYAYQQAFGEISGHFENFPIMHAWHPAGYSSSPLLRWGHIERLVAYIYGIFPDLSPQFE
jgi:hypothetical protein